MSVNVKSVKPTGVVGSVVALVLVFAFVGVIGSCVITIAIWPGQLKLLAPVFCTDAQPDPFVVADTHSPTPGETATDFTLYCMGPRGDSTDHGFAKPFLLISVVNGAAIFALVLLASGLDSLRRRSRSGHDPDDRKETDHRSEAPLGSTAGPFVD